MSDQILFPIFEDGTSKLIGLDRLKEILGSVPGEPIPEPEPDPKRIFWEDFRDDLSIEDGQKPGTGARWADSFPKIGDRWGVRTLAGNGDIGVKTYLKGSTHQVTQNGLALRGVQKGKDYVAGMIYALRSFAFLYGRILIRARINAIGPGQHLSFWLLPTNGDWPPEIDILEVIGSNSHTPNGPINALFFNDHMNGEGIRWYDVPDGFFGQWHDYEVIWTKDEVIWLVDGKEYRRSPNRTNVEMSPLITWELGHNSNKDFPGPINSHSPWPCEVEIQHIGVWQ